MTSPYLERARQRIAAQHGVYVPSREGDDGRTATDNAPTHPSGQYESLLPSVWEMLAIALVAFFVIIFTLHGIIGHY